ERRAAAPLRPSSGITRSASASALRRRYVSVKSAGGHDQNMTPPPATISRSAVVTEKATTGKARVAAESALGRASIQVICAIGAGRLTLGRGAGDATVTVLMTGPPHPSS